MIDEICFIPSAKGIRKLNVHIVYSFQVVQFGRIDANAYTLDFQYPLTAIQAFSVALANVTQRLK